MTRYHATSSGQVPFTPEEEAQRDAEEAAWAAARPLRVKADIERDVQKRLDDFAKTRGYDGILSLCTYATSLNPAFQAEGAYGVQARDATWAQCYEIMADVQAGTRPMPNGYEDIQAELPALEWPA